jgi:hypothetical protein
LRRVKSTIDKIVILVFVLAGFNLLWQFISRVSSDYWHYRDSSELYNQGLLDEATVQDNWIYLIEGLTRFYWVYLVVGLAFIWIAKRLWQRRKPAQNQ